MRILFVIENYYPHIGGAELLFSNLAEGMAARGHKVTVLTRLLPQTKRHETRNGVQIVRISSGDSRYLFTFAAIPTAVRLAKRADVVTTTTPNGAPAAWLAARLAGKPVLLTVLETWVGRWREYTNFPAWKAALHDFLERCVLAPRYDAYACISHATEARLREVRPGVGKRARTIHIGFDAAAWKKKRETKSLRKKLGLEHDFVILGYGRPGASKGFDYLLDAFPRIKKRVPSATLVLILSNDSQYREELREMKRTGHQGLLFLEPQPYKDLPAYAQMADCIVVPSLTEGFGYTTLEGCASGTPVVASNAASIPEVIWGKHVLVTPKSADAIADAVIGVAHGTWKTSREKSFPWKRTLDAYEQLWGELAGVRSSRGQTPAHRRR